MESKCAHCEHIGVVRKVDFSSSIDCGPEPEFTSSKSNPDRVEEHPLSLFTNGSKVYCFDCMCLIANVCSQCLTDDVDLVADIRCEARPHICTDCLDGPVVHPHECYSSGCMTVEEFAEECEEIFADEEFE